MNDDCLLVKGSFSLPWIWQEGHIKITIEHVSFFMLNNCIMYVFLIIPLKYVKVIS